MNKNSRKRSNEIRCDYYFRSLAEYKEKGFIL